MKMTKRKEITPERGYDRGMFRSALVSLFWAVIMERKREPGGFTLQRIADYLGNDKGQVSKWFNGLPNWEANTTADIAGALGVDLQIIARDRHSGKIFTASGAYAGAVSTATTPIGNLTRSGPEATGAQKSGKLSITEMAA